VVRILVTQNRTVTSGTLLHACAWPPGTRRCRAGPASVPTPAPYSYPVCYTGTATLPTRRTNPMSTRL
jgi:hypothetical protein